MPNSLARKQRMTEHTKPRNSLLSLPNELLVYIFAFLPNGRDKMMLQRVSRRLKSVMDKPSLWSEFVWPSYDIREEHCVNSLLRSCGEYIKRLSFPDHVPSSLLKMLPYCINVVHLNLAKTKLDPDQLVMATKHMTQLQTLDILWNTDLMQFVYIMLSMKAVAANLKELTVRVKAKERELDSIHSSLQSFLYWLTKGVMLANLNIVCSHYELRTDLIREWTICNPKTPSGHNSDVKIYTNLTAPLDLYCVLPVFQLQFGLDATLPLVDASKFGLLGFEDDLILLTNHCHADTTVYKAKMWRSASDFQRSKLNCRFNNLDSVIEFDFSSCKSLHSDQLEQLAVMCRNLQRLNLSHNTVCLRNLQRLRTLAKCCHNLQGLNLLGIKVTEVENHMQLWETLSSMKLTYLAIELCNIISVKGDSTYKQDLIGLYQKCSYLRALQLQSSVCSSCDAATDQDILLISNFPSLTYCALGQVPLIVEGIATSCKRLKYLNIRSSFPLLFSADISKCYLQQLFLHSTTSSIPDNFMVEISAHHGLVHVLLCVKLVGYNAVIKNSPKLVTFHIIAHVSVMEDTKLSLNSLKTELKQKYSDTRLFNSGRFEVEEFLSHRSKELLELDIDVASYLWNL